MKIEDLFVGSVSIVLGSGLLLAAWTNSDWYFRLPRAAWLSQRLGRPGARVASAVLGALLIALGMAIIQGFAPNQSSRRTAALGTARSASPIVSPPQLTDADWSGPSAATRRRTAEETARIGPGSLRR